MYNYIITINPINQFILLTNARIINDGIHSHSRRLLPNCKRGAGVHRRGPLHSQCARQRRQALLHGRPLHSAPRMGRQLKDQCSGTGEQSARTEYAAVSGLCQLQGRRCQGGGCPDQVPCMHTVRGAAACHQSRMDRPRFRAAALLLPALEPARECVRPVSEQLEHAHPGKRLLGAVPPEHP